MFQVWCDQKASPVLRWASTIEHTAHPSPGAIDLVVRCLCGELVLIETGRARPTDREVHGTSSARPGHDDRDAGAKRSSWGARA